MTLEQIVAAALAEDLADAGDVTAAATVPADATAGAAFVAREAGVVAGLAAVHAVFAAVDPEVVVEPRVADGDHVEPLTVIASARGRTRSLLAGERTALNLLSQLSGVATATSRYVAELDGTACAVRDTRKTIPGMRDLQKAAVVAGGGVNHRRGLYDGLLVKDNHAVAAGGVAEATRRALAAADGLPVQVEVDSLEELEEALAGGARSVLLDNFDHNDLPAAVARCRRQDAPVFVEASGGIALGSAWAVASTGVDAIAVGALTHSATALDIGLDFAPPEG
ncbi:MAG: carboxylating nicotinate-nucleotide diphosphorylase [Euzebyaceae bacterium]|nr:carboxylating nicotinate-nucleotide diphosphorylase [Euzebyaceae bacterium]